MITFRVYSKSIDKGDKMKNKIEDSIVDTKNKMYSIGEVAELTGLSAHTLRYYEKEGLVFDVERGVNGLRAYSQSNIDMINIITCLKDTGMTISDIKGYVELCKNGQNSYDARAELFKAQRVCIVNQIALLSKHLETTEYKIWYYENIEKLGDESDPNNCKNMKELYNAHCKGDK